MPALRVPCDARMNRRDVELAIAQTVTSRTLRFILCFSASLNGRFKVKSGIEGLKTKEKPSSSFRQASSRNPFYIKTLDTGLRRYDSCVVGRIVLSCQLSPSRY
jgi:hypothetical protein